MNCSTGFGKMHSPLLSAALQSRLAAGLWHWNYTYTAGVCLCNYTYANFLFIKVGRDPTPMLCSTAQGEVHAPLLSAALQNRLTAGLSHCKCTYANQLFIQVDSYTTQINCSTGKMHSPLLSAALQNRLKAGWCHCNCLCKFAVHTGGQRSSISAVQHWFWHNVLPTAQCCSANQSDSKLVSLQKKPYAGLLFRQVCIDPTPMHCSSGFRVMHFALPGCSANQADSRLVSLQKHLCKYAVHTGDQSTTTMHCSSGCRKTHSALLVAALQNRLTAGLCHCSCIYANLLSI